MMIKKGGLPAKVLIFSNFFSAVIMIFFCNIPFFGEKNMNGITTQKKTKNEEKELDAVACFGYCAIETVDIHMILFIMYEPIGFSIQTDAKNE